MRLGPKRKTKRSTAAASEPLRHPPLSEVIFELTFPRLFAVENHIADYQQKVSEMYPNSSDAFSLHRPVPASKSAQSEGADLVRNFVFQNATSTRTVRVSVLHFSLLVSDYLHFEDYKNALTAALNPAIDIFQLRRLERVGLRYINKITIPKASPLGYQDYVHSPIDTSAFPSNQLSSFLTEVSVNLDQAKRLTIRNGLLPSENDERTYLLDFDCSSPGSVSLSGLQLSKLLNEYHEAIETEFKRAMTEKYWKYMAGGAPM